MKKLAVVAIALVSWMSANAQVGTVVSRTIQTTTTTRVVEVDYSKYNRLSIGYASYKHGLGNASSDLEDDLDYEAEGLDAWPGLVAEYIHGWSLTKSHPLYLESGIALQFNMKSSDDSDYNYMHIGLAIPLNLTYRLSTKKGLFIAPVVGLNLGSNCYDDALYELEDDYYDDECSRKYFQLGYNLGANLGYKHLNIGIGYRGDFMPSFTTEDEGSIKTGTFHIGIGVNF